MKLGPAFALAVLCAAGCQSVSLVDDVDIDLNWTPLVGPSDSLHTPYVLGAHFAVWAQLSGGESRDGLSIVSSDPTILTIGDSALGGADNSLYAPAQALATGTVDIMAVRGSHVEHRHTVEVMFPDRVDVLPHGPLLVDLPDVTSVDSPEILAGYQATFLVQYYAGGQHLNGYGALAATTDSPTVITPDVATSAFLETRDWLQVTALTEDAAQATVQLAVGGKLARTLPVQVVTDAAISDVQLNGQSESHAHDGESLTVWAEARDASGGDIYGTQFTFTANGVQQAGVAGDETMGDLYRYTYDKKMPVALEASHGTLSDGIMIMSSGGYVDSTNNVGCQSAPGRAPRDLGLAVILLGLALASSQRLRFSRARDLSRGASAARDLSRGASAARDL